jgi:hypothetical protein
MSKDSHPSDALDKNPALKQVLPGLYVCETCETTKIGLMDQCVGCKKEFDLADLTFTRTGLEVAPHKTARLCRQCFQKEVDWDCADSRYVQQAAGYLPRTIWESHAALREAYKSPEPVKWADFSYKYVIGNWSGGKLPEGAVKVGEWHEIEILDLKAFARENGPIQVLPPTDKRPFWSIWVTDHKSSSNPFRQG